MKFFPMLWLSLAMLLLSAASLAASQADTYNANVAQAKAWATTPSQAVDVHEYCTGSACSEVDNPSAARYYGDDAATTNAAKQQAASDTQVQAIGQAASHRHTVDINDPAYRYAVNAQDNAYEISHGLSNKYVDCDSGAQCIDELTTKSCEAPTHNPVSCHRTPEVEGQSLETGATSVALNNTMTPTSIHLPSGVTAIERIDLPLSYAFCTAQESVHCLLVIRNAGSVYTTDLAELKHDINCANFVCTTRVFAQTFATNIPISSNQVTLSLGIGTKTSFTEQYFIVFQGTMTLHWQKKTNNIVWKTDCGTMLPECHQTQSTCTEPGETRWINGVPTTLGCWKYEQTYQCDFDNQCDSATPQARVNQYQDTTPSCVPKGKPTCTLTVLGVCVKQSQPYQCTTKKCKTHLICGTPSFCLDGDCYDPAHEKNTHFDESAAEVAAVNEGAKGVISSDAMTGFSGKAASCDKKPIGMANCCDGSGWGEDIDLTSCTDGEKALMKAKQKDLVHTVGSYCSKKVLGVCMEHREGDCEYPNLLSKLVSEQGKAQLGKTFGSPENPNCSGFTPDEMSQLDFSKIDLTAYYQEMESQIDLPDPDDLKKQVTPTQP